MRVELGPVDAVSARAFVAYGRQVLEAPPGQALPDDIRGAFFRYLGEWAGEARPGDTVRWSRELSCDDAKYLLHALHRLACDVQAGVVAGDLEPLPGAAAAFYRTLVRAMLDVVAVESDGCAAWAEDLGRFWPGLEPVERTPLHLVGSR